MSFLLKKYLYLAFQERTREEGHSLSYGHNAHNWNKTHKSYDCKVFGYRTKFRRISTYKTN